MEKESFMEEEMGVINFLRSFGKSRFSSLFCDSNIIWCNDACKNYMQFRLLLLNSPKFHLQFYLWILFSV
jgi:hypothetical protein